MPNILAVFRFEWQRSMSLARLAWWFVMAAFPAVLTGVLVWRGVVMEDPTLEIDPRWTLVLYALVPNVVCYMGLLLWVTPVVHAELQGRSWSYLAVRPGGKLAILVGKYCAAVTWTALAAWAGLVASVVVARPSHAGRMLLVLAALTLLSCVAYGALYALLGVLFRRRAMVVAVAYTLIFEFIVTYVPAVINQLTVQYRLRCLLIGWMNWEDQQHQLVGGPLPAALFGTAPWWHHVSIVLLTAMGLLAIAAVVLRRSELVTPDEV
jgi:ABC-type transport system involved in multi-copper enzyme maturation permease subunit